MTNDPEEMDARAPLAVANMGMVLIVSKPSGDAAKPLAACCAANRSKSASRSSTETASNRSRPEPKHARVFRIFHANASAAVRTDDASVSARAPSVARAHPGPPAATSSTGAFAVRRRGASQRQRSARGSAADENVAGEPDPGAVPDDASDARIEPAPVAMAPGGVDGGAGYAEDVEISGTSGTSVSSAESSRLRLVSPAPGVSGCGEIGWDAAPTTAAESTSAAAAVRVVSSESSESNAPGGGANTAALCPTRTSSSPRTGTSGHAAKCSSASGGARAISFQNAVNHASEGSAASVPSSPRRLAVGDAPIPAGDRRGGSVRGSSAANCACVNSRTDISARNLGCASNGPSVVDDDIRECANRDATRGANADISADAVHSVPDPSRATSPPAVGTGTPAKSRTAARSMGGDVGSSDADDADADAVAPPRPAAASQSFTGTPAAAIASTTPVSESSGGAVVVAAFLRVAVVVARTSDAAHSMSSTCVRSAVSSRPAGAGGFVRSNFRNAAAVSSRAAPPTPAAASSGRSDAGASITGKCREMKAAASGRATPPPPHEPSANPSGRKYPSEGFNAAFPPKLRNSAFSPSSRYRGFTNNSDAGCVLFRADTASAAPANERPARSATDRFDRVDTDWESATRPSGSSSGGGGSPNDSDRGHMA